MAASKQWDEKDAASNDDGQSKSYIAEADEAQSPPHNAPTSSLPSSPPLPPAPAPPPPPPPNGGYGWVVTACCCLINAHTFGINSTYGVFLAHYLSTNTFPGATSLEYAFVGSLSISCAFLISPLATISTRWFGTKVTLSIGVVFETASLIGASFAREIWQLFLSQGVCFGIGMGFLYIGSVGVLSSWFTTRRSLANGIGAAGSGAGGLVYSLATGRMIESIGLAWSFRVLGIIAFAVNAVCTILIRDRNKLIGARQAAFDARLFQRVEYLLLCVFSWFSMLAYVVLLFSLANYGNEIGLSSQQAALVSALLNLGQAVGRPPIGYFSDSIGRLNMAALMTFLSGLFSLVIWTFAKSYGVLIFYAILGGTVAGTFWATVSPLAAEVTGLRRVPSALNLIWLVIVIPCTFSEPIGLEIVDSSRSYLGTQLWVGFMYIAAALCLVVLRGWKIGELEALARMKLADQGDESAVEDNEEMAERARKEGRLEMWVHLWKWRKV